MNRFSWLCRSIEVHFGQNKNRRESFRSAVNNWLTDSICRFGFTPFAAKNELIHRCETISTTLSNLKVPQSTWFCLRIDWSRDRSNGTTFGRHTFRWHFAHAQSLTWRHRLFSGLPRAALNMYSIQIETGREWDRVPVYQMANFLFTIDGVVGWRNRLINRVNLTFIS